MSLYTTHGQSSMIMALSRTHDSFITIDNRKLLLRFLLSIESFRMHGRVYAVHQTPLKSEPMSHG